MTSKNESENKAWTVTVRTWAGGVRVDVGEEIAEAELPDRDAALEAAERLLRKHAALIGGMTSLEVSVAAPPSDFLLQRGRDVTPEAMAEAAELGLSKQEVLAMARRSAHYTRRDVNRRFRDYALRIEDGVVQHIRLADREDRDRRPHGSEQR